MLRLVLRGFPGIAVALFLAAPAGQVVAAERDVAAQQTRQVYVSVLNDDGAPVLDMTADEFAVEEGGQACEVVSAELTADPIRLALIVADGGTGAFQQSLAALIQRMYGVTQFSLTSVIEQADHFMAFTDDTEELVAGVQRLGPRGGQQLRGQILDAIVETIPRVPQEGHRGVIVVMTLGGGAGSPIREQDVLEDLRESGIRLYVVSPRGSGGGEPNLEVVLNDGSVQTGGRNMEISTNTVVPVVEALGDELLGQYKVTYTLPAGVDPNERLEVSTSRDDVRVWAPRRVATD